MLARCTACRQLFRTETFGLTRCAHCGVEVHVAGPEPEPSPASEQPRVDQPVSLSAFGAQQPGASAVGALEDAAFPGGRTPWERRAELGLGAAFVQTVKLVMLEPTRFFSNIRYDDVEGVHLFFLLATVLPALLMAVFSALGDLATSGLMEAVGGGASAAQAAQSIDQLAAAGVDASALEPLRKWMEVSSSPWTSVATVVATPLKAYAMLYGTAGVSHLVLMLFGRARSWNATFKVFAYSFAAGLFHLLPCCGGLVVYSWATVTQMIGLAKSHGTASWVATTAVIGWHVAALLLTCGALLLVGLPVLNAVTSMTGP